MVKGFGLQWRKVRRTGAGAAEVLRFAQDDNYFERWSVGASQTRSAAARPSETLPAGVERVRV